MKRTLLCLSLLFSVLFGTYGNADASGRAYVKVGQKIDLSTNSNIANPNIQWILKKGDEVIAQTNGKAFSVSFTETGIFTINIVASSTDGTETERTTVEIESVVNPPIYSRTGAVIESLPSASKEDGKIHLWGEEARVSFSFSRSSGEIKEYRFDGNIYEDSDGNGVVDDDRENKNDPSFFSGESFSRVYKNNKKPIRAVLTVVNREGKEETDSIDIVFDKQKPDLKKDPLKAILQTLPTADEDGIIHLSGNEAEVTLFAGLSEGDIQEYRIDKNLNMDSNADGDIKNDIDNITDISFQNGQPWVTTFKKEWEPIVVQLMVVQKNGKGSLIQRKIVFDTGEKNFLPVLITSHEQIFKGDSVTFRVFNAPEDTQYSWDFNGDGIFEKEKSESSEIIYRFAEEGTFSAKVRLEKEGNEPIDLGREIIVGATKPGESNTSSPTANFSFSIEKNTVSFDASESFPDGRLSNPEMSYTWEFGDGNFGNGKTVQHTYTETGDFVAILRIEDSVEKRASTSRSFAITELPVSPPPPTEETPTIDPEASPSSELPEQSSETPSFPSFPWWLILLLLVFILPLGYFVWKKINDPDKTFEEIWEETLETFQKKKETLSQSPSTKTSEIENTASLESRQSSPPVWIRDHETEGVIDSSVEQEKSEKEEETEAQKEISTNENNNESSEVIPPWLQTQKQEEVSIEEENTEYTPESSEEIMVNDEPDWMKESSATEEQVPTETEALSAEESTQTMENLTEEGEEILKDDTLDFKEPEEKEESSPTKNLLNETDTEEETLEDTLSTEEFRENEPLKEQEVFSEEEQKRTELEESFPEQLTPLEKEETENLQTISPESEAATEEITESPPKENEQEEVQNTTTTEEGREKQETEIPLMPPLEPISYEEAGNVPNWLSEGVNISTTPPSEEQNGQAPQKEEASPHISNIVEEAKKDLPEWLKKGIENQEDMSIKGEKITLSPLPQEETADIPEFKENEHLESPEAPQKKEEQASSPVSAIREELLLPMGGEDSPDLSPQIQTPEKESPNLPFPPIHPVAPPSTPFSEEIPSEEETSNEQSLPEWLRTKSDSNP